MTEAESAERTSAKESRIIIGRGGWILYEDPALKAEVRLRLAVDRDGQLKITALHLQAPKNIDGTLLREIPVGHILARLRASGGYLWVRREVETAGWEMAQKVRELDDYLVRSIDQEAAPAPVDFTALLRLFKQYPGRAKRPDEFYAEVARVFTQASATTRRPAEEMARRLKVPTSSVHRWVKESKRRGVFGPAASPESAK